MFILAIVLVALAASAAPLVAVEPTPDPTPDKTYGYEKPGHSDNGNHYGHYK
jgi:hypothetical protein